MNYRILIVVGLIMITVGSIFSITMRSYIHTYDSDWEGVFSFEDNENTKKKIFLIGSSGIYSIDATKINQIFEEEKIDYEIYNLSDVADNPKKRLASIQNILDNSPDFVVLGFGILEFEEKKKLDYEIWEYILYPKNFKNKIFEETIDPIINDIQTSPKERHLILIKNTLFGPDQKYHPFVKHYPTEINKLEELVGTEHKIDMSESSERIIALRDLVDRLQEEEIGITLVTNPYSDVAFKKIPSDEIRKFEEFFEEFSKKKDIGLYFLHEKYSELDIWRDPSHIAVHPDAEIYTDDMIQIILKEISKDAI